MMSTRTFIIAMMLSALFGNTAQAQQLTEQANFQRYAEENAALGEPSKGEKRVVFFGNSITEEWVRLRPDFFKKHGFIGRGISGQSSYNMLLRFREDVLKLKPKLLVINCGTNDVAENSGPYDEEITFGNIVSMLELAKCNVITVILTSVLPAKSFKWRPGITDAMQKIRHLNARLRQYAKANKIAYVDYFNAMLSPDGSGLDPEYTPETVHPNVAGYKVMESLILPAIEKAR